MDFVYREFSLKVREFYCTASEKLHREHRVVQDKDPIPTMRIICRPYEEVLTKESFPTFETDL